MEGFVYLIKSKRFKWYYVGSTKSLKARIEKYNLGKVKSTKFYKPFSLVYFEGHVSYNIARRREEELKKNNQQRELLYKRIGIK